MSQAPLPRLTLVIGGARSGKSTFAETLVMRTAPPWTYVATAEAFDAEMSERIAQHRSRRDAGWQTRDAPRDVPAVVRALAVQRGTILIDCLTLWLSNLLLDGRDLDAEGDALLAALSETPHPVVVVSNEVGLGIVPDNALARRFRDAQGRLNQRVAAVADRVVLMTAGLPLVLKEPPDDR